MSKKLKTCALIQVRMSSSRFPGKALCDIDGITTTEHVINSLKMSRKIDEIILATSIDPGDDPLEALAKENNISFFRGYLNNIAKRFLGASQKFNADMIVRITGDCPFVSYELVDLLIDSHLKTNADYSGFETGKLPVGVGSEVFSVKALKRLVQFDMDFDYSEYMTFYFKNNPQVFSISIVSVPNEFQYPEYRLTFDYKEDLKMFNQLSLKIKEKNLARSLSNILLVLKECPEIAKLNSHLTLKYQTDKQLVDKINKATIINIDSK